MLTLRRWPRLAAATCLVLAACSTAAKPSANRSRLSSGGTLRVISPYFAQFQFPSVDTPSGKLDTALDPQFNVNLLKSELYRCCLLRTLLSYNGQPTDRGGAELRPDLATRLPDVSADGLTWTFHIRPGIRYGPPLQSTEITARDFIRAIEREFAPLLQAVVKSLPFPAATVGDVGRADLYQNLIVGANEFAAGKADSISGLEAPDPHTLVVHLTRPSGDLGYRFSLSSSAPIPPNPSDPSAKLGVAAGHEATYGSFLVSSGPYMIEGSEHLDFSKPPADQEPAAGYIPGRSIVLVRNPSWHPSLDHLRKAYADRIEIRIGGTEEEASNAVVAGGEDTLYETDPSAADVSRYQANPSLSDRVFVNPADVLRYLTMNLAVPPFDDINVRKAVNDVINKRRLLELAASTHLHLSGPFGGDPAQHLVPDSLEDNLLVDYDPYSGPDHQGDLVKAKSEMRRSPYDTNGDGLCDASACRSVLAVTRNDEPFYAAQAKVVRENLAGIGIRLHIQALDDMYSKIGDPAQRVPMALGVLFLKDFPNASTFFDGIFTGNGIEQGLNYSLVGATPDQLMGWGYRVRTVPSVDAKVAACIPLVGETQATCWAELDQLLMEEIVPWVPYEAGNRIRIVSARVAAFSFDQFTTLPALDQIALKR
jgi:peptide/nickel transport system substrate-binding protein